MNFLHVVTLPVHARVLTSAIRRPLQAQVRVPLQLVITPRGQRGLVREVCDVHAPAGADRAEV